jgi:hypothetical protein
MYPFSFLGGGVNVADAIVSAFQERVQSDSGTFEAYDCMVTQIDELLKININ